MPVIYLKHPRHGSKVACAEAEAVYDEARGWERYSVEAVPAQTSSPQPSAAEWIRAEAEKIDSRRQNLPANDQPAKRKYTRRAA